MKVHKLVRLRLGRSAQSGSVCERKMNVGGGNERAFLSQEAGVATKGSSLDNEGVCFLFACFVLLLLLLFVFPNEMILALAQARSIHSVKQGSSSSEKRWRFPVLHSICPSTVASWAKEIRDSQQSGKLTEMGCVSDHAVLWDYPLQRGQALVLCFSGGTRVSRARLSHEEYWFGRRQLLTLGAARMSSL